MLMGCILESHPHTNLSVTRVDVEAWPGGGGVETVLGGEGIEGSSTGRDASAIARSVASVILRRREERSSRAFFTTDWAAP